MTSIQRFIRTVRNFWNRGFDAFLTLIIMKGGNSLADSFGTPGKLGKWQNHFKNVYTGFSCPL